MVMNVDYFSGVVLTKSLLPDAWRSIGEGSTVNSRTGLDTWDFSNDMIKGYGWRHREARFEIFGILRGQVLLPIRMQSTCPKEARSYEQQRVTKNDASGEKMLQMPTKKQRHLQHTAARSKYCSTLWRPLHQGKSCTVTVKSICHVKFRWGRGSAKMRNMLQIATQCEFDRFFNYYECFNFSIGCFLVWDFARKGMNCCKWTMNTGSQLAKDFGNWTARHWKGSKYALMSVAGLLASRQCCK